MMLISGSMQGQRQPRGVLARAATVAAAAVLALGLAPLTWATDTTCNGEVQDDAGYVCTRPGHAVIPDIGSGQAQQGTRITSWKPSGCAGDDCYFPDLFASGQMFDWYGNSYDRVYVNSNGYLSFGIETAPPSQGSHPSSSSPNNAFYPYADDLDASGLADPAGVWVNDNATCDVDGDGTFSDACYVAQWEQVPDFFASGTVTVRAALIYGSNQAVVFIENDIGAAFPLLVGTENSAGTIGLRYVAASGDTNSNGATTGDRLLFGPETAAPTVTSSDPAPGETAVAVNAPVVVNFDTPMNTSSVSLSVLSGTNPGGWSPSWSNDDKRVTYSHNAFTEDETLVLAITGNSFSGTALTQQDAQVNTNETCPANSYCWDFTTEDATAPGAVTKLTSASGDLQVTLEWINPGDTDLTGVLILRKQGSAVDAAPTDGVDYEVGDLLGVGNEVVFDGSGTSFTDVFVSNGNTYHYAVYPYDDVRNYGPGHAISGLPRSSASFKWVYTSDATTLAPPASVGGTYLVGSGNDRLVHRMAEVDGERDGWVPPLLGGAVQARPKAGDLDPDGTASDWTAFMTAQNGFVYRVNLEGNGDAAAVEANTDAITDAGCASGILQGGPVVMLNEFGDQAYDVVAVGTRCGSTNNALLLYDHSLNLLDTFTDASGNSQLGIMNGTPLLLYRSGDESLLYATMRDDGGESVVAVEIGAGPSFVLPPWRKITGVGDIDASPEIARRGNDPLVFFGNTQGSVYMALALLNTDATRDQCQPGACATYTSDGPVKGLAASTPITLGGTLYENWLVWSTDTTVHGIKVDSSALFDESTYWSLDVSGPSTPLVLRFVGGQSGTYAYVGSSDGRLYEIDATTGSILSSTLVESGHTIGAPTFDYNDGTNQGIVVGSSSGRVHWVQLD
jgi:hypothetical protein